MIDIETVLYKDCCHVNSISLLSSRCNKRYFLVNDYNNMRIKKIIVCNDYMRLKLQEVKYSYKYQEYQKFNVNPYCYNDRNKLSEYELISAVIRGIVVDVLGLDKQEICKWRDNYKKVKLIHLVRPDIVSEVDLFDAIQLLKDNKLPSNSRDPIVYQQLVKEIEKTLRGVIDYIMGFTSYKTHHDLGARIKNKISRKGVWSGLDDILPDLTEFSSKVMYKIPESRIHDTAAKYHYN